MNIRKATLGDLENIIYLMRLNPDVFSEKEIPKATMDIKKIIRSYEGRYYVLEDGKKIIGCLGYEEQEDSFGVYRLKWFAIRPEYQRKGHGTKLYNFVENKLKSLGAKSILLETGDGERNNHFYEKNGFELAGTISGYYGPIDQIWYQKTL